MKQAVYKYPLELIARQTLRVPASFKPIFVAIQTQGRLSRRDSICLWAQLDEGDFKIKEVAIKIVGTGNAEIDVTDVYVGSVMTDDFVWHIYMEQE